MEQVSLEIGGLQGKVRECSELLEKARRELKRSSTFATTGTNWFASLNNEEDIESAYKNQRERIAESDSLLEETNRSVFNSQRLAQENEEMGMSTLTELNRNRATLERANQHLYVIDDNMSKTRRMILNMTRKAATNKCILAFIILLLLASIGFVVWFRWFRTK